MKTDRELLELAAKAAGIEVTAVVADGIPHRFSGGYWNPLTDDGDALRLAVKLKLEIDIGESCALVWRRKYEGVFEQHIKKKFDIYAATRRAIVHAAATIGESMP